MSGSEADRRHMARAIELAARGDYRVHRNPKVGAVLARGAQVLGEGWHIEAGGPHAEAAAFADARTRGHDPLGATLYVTLEPCGPLEGKRTPPCVAACVEAGLARVFAATRDPHPEVSGRSFDRLREAGVVVEVGLLEDAARRLNGPFAKWFQHELPYVTAKWAMSLDGKIACHTGASQWISSEASRRLTHVLRGEVDAIAIGIETALADDPRLTRRDVPGRDPLRVVLDSQARLPLASQLVLTARERPVLLATTAGADAARRAALTELGVEVESLGTGRVDPGALLEALAKRGVRHLLLEGGGEVLAAFFSAGLVDRVLAFLAPKVIGGEGAPGPVRGAGAASVADAVRLLHLTARPSGEDVLLEGHVHLY